jgi:pyrroloquinoline quinone (PQQ) biosynthesis protein C
MKEEFVRSHMNCEVGQEIAGYTLEEWAYIKNIPKYLLVKRIRTEEEKSKKKDRKAQKRK